MTKKHLKFLSIPKIVYKSLKCTLRYINIENIIGLFDTYNVDIKN